MRRSLFGFLAILMMVAGILVTTGCERANTLRVVTVNNGKELQSDIADFYKYFNKEDSEYVTIYIYQPDTVEFEAQYVEIGLGLPTWTPYQATINKATITYKSADAAVAYDNVTMPLTVSVPSDREGKKTVKFQMVVIPSWWKEKFFGDDVVEPPDYDLLDYIDATIKFQAVDSLAGRTIEATCKLAIEIGNLYDDEGAIGK